MPAPKPKLINETFIRVSQSYRIEMENFGAFRFIDLELTRRLVVE